MNIDQLVAEHVAGIGVDFGGRTEWRPLRIKRSEYRVGAMAVDERRALLVVGQRRHDGELRVGRAECPAICCGIVVAVDQGFVDTSAIDDNACRLAANDGRAIDDSLVPGRSHVRRYGRAKQMGRLQYVCNRPKSDEIDQADAANET